MAIPLWVLLIWRLLPREGQVLVLAGLVNQGLAVLLWYDMVLVAECLAQLSCCLSGLHLISGFCLDGALIHHRSRAW